MPMIVSGLDPQVRMNAYVAGHQAQMALKKQQDAQRIQQDEQRAAYAKQMQDAMLKHKQEQAKATADANARAQMGDAQAMEQQNIEAMAQKQPPEQRRLQEMSGVLSKITDPKARDYARDEFMRYEKDLRAEQQKQAAMSVIDTAAKDGIVDGQVMQQRIQSGEEPETIAQEVGKARHEQAAASVAMNESANSLAKAQMLIDSMPEDSPIRQRSELALAMFSNSKTAQETPGAGKKMLSQIQKLIQAEDFKSGVEDIRGGLSGVMFGTRGPEGPTPGTHATMEGLKSGKVKPGARNPQVERSIMSGVAAAISAGRSPGEWLASQGVELTPEVVELIRGLASQGAPDAATAEAE